MAIIYDLEDHLEVKKGKGWESFKEAIKSHGLFIASGLISGLALIVIEDFFELKSKNFWLHILGLSLEHLGLGLIVSSIAVFGYEWRSHVKKVVDLSGKLQQSIKEVARIRETLRKTGTLLELLTKESNQSLDASLRAFLGEDNHLLLTNLRRFIETISEIQKDEANNETQTENQDEYFKLVKKQYISVTEWLLQRTVLTNALQFKKVVEGGEGHFNVPATSGDMADTILATQMSIMHEEDSYDVVSDVSSWRDNLLKEFKKESIKKINSKKFKVRRVFNLFRPGLPLPHSATYKDACDRTIQTLREHLQSSKDFSTWTWRGYELKVFWEDELNNAKEDRYHNFSDYEFRDAHFGLFIHKEPRKVIRFRVELENLSNMLINWDPDEIGRDVELFKTMWRLSTRLDEKTIDDIDKKLKERIPSPKVIPENNKIVKQPDSKR
jgi:hypothetical protein